MLAAIKDIGQLIIERDNKDELDVLIENPDANGIYKNVLAIIFDYENNTVKYKETVLEEFSREKIRKYLYRKGSASGADFSPSAKLSGKIEGTFDRKIYGWFNILNNRNCQITEEERIFLEQIKDQLAKNSEIIKEKIVEIRNKIPKKEGILLTIKIKIDNQEKYPGEFPVFIKIFQQAIKAKDEKISVENGICSLCGQQKPLIYGNIDTYAFYTIDKPGFIIGGFDEKTSWRNFPVCPQCKLALEEGKNYIEENLTFRFCGFSYNLIPKFISCSQGVSEYILDTFINTAKVNSLKERTIKSITGAEDDILFELKEINDSIVLNLLFIQKMNAAEKILLHIEDVFPSRLREIFAAKDETDRLYNNNFTLQTIRSFFSKSDNNKKNTDLDKYFLEITDRVFKDRPINVIFIIKYIMKKLRTELINEGYFYKSTKDGLALIKFLESLCLISMEEEKMEKRLFNEMFEKYGPSFATNLKRGLFLLGALTELLLRKQYTERNSRPFLKNLKNLKMDEKDFKGLLPKIQNKLTEYQSFDKGKKTLAQEISYYLLKAGDNWKMSVDEMNFYFSAGMNLVEEVVEIIYPDKSASFELMENNNE